MDEIKTILWSIQEEMKQQKADMMDMKEEIKNTITNNMNEKFQALELKTEVLEQKIEYQKNKIDSMERILKKKNVLFFGVEERERSYEDLIQIVLQIMNHSLNIECNVNSIEFVRRLGKKGKNMRPIIVTLCNMGLKLKILKHKKKLASSPYYVKEDFPLEVLKRRRELQMELNKAIEAGNTAIIKYDKLVFLERNKGQKNNPMKQNSNTTENIEQGKNHNKRDPSISPDSLRSSNNNRRTNRSSKSVKNNSMTNYLTKKPTLTLQGSVTQPTRDKENTKTTH